MDPFENVPCTPTGRTSALPANTPESSEQVIQTTLFNVVSPDGTNPLPVAAPAQPAGETQMQQAYTKTFQVK